METPSGKNLMGTPSIDKLAIFVIAPHFITDILSRGLCAKPTHGIKDMEPVSLGIDQRSGNLILCVSSDSVPEYMSYMRIMGYSIATISDTLVLNDVELTGIPVITATFENIPHDTPNQPSDDQPV